MDIQNVLTQYASDNEVVHKFCDDIYNELFSDNFREVRSMYKRMKSEIHPITDEELEYILTTFPMELFTVAENLNKLRLDREVVKLKNKETYENLRESATKESQALDMKKSEAQEYINHKIAQQFVEYEVVLSAYDAIIGRVENEQSFSRELIMGAKKIWDSRRSSERVNPVGPAVAELPEYNRQTYVK